jgi:hypothetical protein
MITLETKGGTLTRIQRLPTATVGKGKIGRAAAAAYVPAVGYGNGFAESQCYRPAGDGCGAAVGYGDIHLIESAARIAGSCRTGVRGRCLGSKQQAAQQHSKFEKNFH